VTDFAEGVVYRQSQTRRQVFADKQAQKANRESKVHAKPKLQRMANGERRVASSE